jgi:hypothetical protein
LEWIEQHSGTAINGEHEKFRTQKTPPLNCRLLRRLQVSHTSSEIGGLETRGQIGQILLASISRLRSFHLPAFLPCVITHKQTHKKMMPSLPTSVHPPPDRIA